MWVPVQSSSRHAWVLFLEVMLLEHANLLSCYGYFFKKSPISFLREENGNPLHYSCLGNSTDREAWQATVHGVTRVRQDLATKPPPPHFSYSTKRSAMSLQASPSHTYQFLLVVKFTFLRSVFYYPFNYQTCI